MTVSVTFFKTRSLDDPASRGVGFIRARESVSIPGTTTNSVQDGEYVVVLNEEASAVLVAHGSTPDATASVATSATTAGYPVETGTVSPPFVPAMGSKLNVKDVP